MPPSFVVPDVFTGRNSSVRANARRGRGISAGIALKRVCSFFTML